MKNVTSLIMIMGLTVLTGANPNRAKKLDRTDLELPRTLQAVRLTTGSINIDGSMDDIAWQNAIVRSNFVQRNPLEGTAPTENTEFSILYDDEYLYVGVKAYDSSPDSIRSILARRDEETPSDWVNVSFDSYSDHRTAFEFWLNPQGVKRDLRRYDDEEIDTNWDAIWEGQSRIDSDGWTAEFRIPLRELRFSSDDSQDWGLQVYRHISRKNEDNYWTYWSKNEGGWVRHYGRLTNLNNIPKQRQIYVAPYTTGQYSSSANYKTDLHPNSYNMGSNMGADLKIGVTNNLTLDITLNPDFGQVEADPAELNLSAFESFFSEKRPFFVEGSNIYSFGLGVGDGGGSSTTLFYPRRIGRSPHFSGYDGVSEEVDDDESITYEVDDPSSTSIVGAAKLTGKTASGWSIGVMEAVGNREISTVNYSDRGSEKYVVEPLSNYFVTRLSRDLNEGRTSIGAIVTSVDRDLSGDRGNSLFGDASQDSDLMKSNLREHARSGGIDFRHRFNDDTYEFESAIAGTNISGSKEAILAAQRHPNRYYQRPDASHLSIDSSLTSLSGFYAKAVLSKIKGKHIQWAIGNLSYSPGFESNDIGFSRGVDEHNQFIWAQYRENEPGKKIRRWSVNLNAFQSFTFAGMDEMTERGGNINGNLTLSNYWNLNAGFFGKIPGAHVKALWGGPSMQQDAMRNVWGGISSDSRKEFSFGGFGYSGSQPNGGVSWTGLSPRATWRPTKNFSMRVSGEYNTGIDTWAVWGGFGTTTDLQTGEEYYVMATLDQTTLSTTLRLDYTISPTLSIQFYGAPFVTAGTFRADKIVDLDNTFAENFDDRFSHHLSENVIGDDGELQPFAYDIDGDGIANIDMIDAHGERDFNYKAFNSNLVLRWEYITGSSLFFVWSRNMSDYQEQGQYGGFGDMQDLLGLTGENVFLLKASYLLNL